MVNSSNIFELTLSIENAKSNVIDFLFDKLSAQVKFNNGVIVKVKSQTRTNLSLAVNKKQKDYFILLLLELISEVITIEYKSEFFENNLGLIYNSPIMQTALISALTVFDKQTDKDLIKKSLILEKEFYIDRFYWFKLGALRQRWSDICQLVTDNSIRLKLSGGSNDLIKFLLKTSEVNALEVHLIDQNENFLVADSLNNPICALSSVNPGGELTTLKNLIMLSPSKIIVYPQGKEKPLNKLLYSLFEDRIVINQEKNYNF